MRFPKMGPCLRFYSTYSPVQLGSKGFTEDFHFLSPTQNCNKFTGILFYSKPDSQLQISFIALIAGSIVTPQMSFMLLMQEPLFPFPTR